MGRQHRIYFPGAAHHIVTRIQGHHDWIVERLRSTVAEMITEGIAVAGARLIAYSVMPNHLHVLLFQGSAPLGSVMQRPLRRIALLLQRYHRLQGHVFERRFRNRVCKDQKHLRNSILYIHRNPLQAGLCTTASAYPWSSHPAYLGKTECAHIALEEGLRIVTCRRTSSTHQMRAAYRKTFLAYCQLVDDDDFIWTYAPRLPRMTSPNDLPRIPVETPPSAPLVDLHDAVMRLLAVQHIDCPLVLLRSNFRGRQLVQIRCESIATLLQRGYSGTAIAEYFRISPSAVSRVRTAMRWGTLR